MSQTFQNFERAFDNLQGIGRMWATYGVNISKTALDTGAERLKATAAYLEGLSQRMDDIRHQIAPKTEEQVPEPSPQPEPTQD